MKRALSTYRGCLKEMKRVSGNEGEGEEGKSGLKRVKGAEDIEDIHLNHKFTLTEVAAIQTNLVRWYGSNKREMPWRNVEGLSEQSKAYRVWVSEIMLQQTQVATVIPYFNRFMLKFPTVTDLANASEDSIKEIWSGLGFYRRASMLHDAAKKVVKDLNGEIPNTSAKLLKELKGVGPYTAGAIASVVWNEEAPIVDGNVIRVLSRLRMLGGNPKSKEASTKHWELAKTLISGCGEESGSFNQGLMELGATVCKISNPDCEACPLKEACWATREGFALPKNVAATDPRFCGVCQDWTPKEGTQGAMRFPPTAPKLVKKDMFALMMILELENEGGYILQKRPSPGLLAGMWQFPLVEFDGVKSSVDRKQQVAAQINLLAQILDDVAVSFLDTMRSISSFKHVFSHINQQVYVHHVVISRDDLEDFGGESFKIVQAQDVASKGICKSTSKAFEALIKKN
jgi:A/G-specific adenine glycosylase